MWTGCFRILCELNYSIVASSYLSTSKTLYFNARLGQNCYNLPILRDSLVQSKSLGSQIFLDFVHIWLGFCLSLSPLILTLLKLPILLLLKLWQPKRKPYIKDYLLWSGSKHQIWSTKLNCKKRWYKLRPYC